MSGLDRMKKRIQFRGNSISSDQFARMQQSKLYSMKKALYASYQAAVVQKYVASEGEEQTSPYFRCLINKEKQHVDYEDKEISIPFEECTVTIDPVKDNDDLVETNFHTGTVFIWKHGNKEEWVPDSYWIVEMQYSEETAYFRGEIRKADELIEIIPISEDGTEGDPLIYRGWTSGPDETEAVWNVKKNIAWNDLYYTKLLYITKDETTSAFFKRFDRVNINGKPWEVEGYNDNYGSSSSDPNTGIIRVALKETYTSTDQEIKEQKETQDTTEVTIIGPDTLSPFDSNIKYTVVNGGAGSWSVTLPTSAAASLSDIISYSIDSNNNLIINVETTKSYKTGFNITYGETTKHVVIKS